MGHSNGVISDPVNTDDINATIGVLSHDIGYLCSNEHGKTCKWAKYKPVIVNQPGEITEAQRKSVNHGLAVTNALQSDGYTYNLAEWTYNAPSPYKYNSAGQITGGRGEFCRENDFIGYVHTAKPPIYIISDEPDEAGCTVVTWDEGTTKIDDFKIVAGYTCGNSIVGPPSQAGIKMDELNFGASTNIANCTFGLLQVAGQTKMYLGASQKFNYGTGEAPYCNFGTKFSSSSSGYNYIAQNLKNIAVGGYIEVLPVIDTMDFSANKVSAPNSGLTGFPVGKKLRIYHQKTEDWYMTGITSNITLYYVTDKGSGATVQRGILYHTQPSSGGFSRELPSDPANQYYILSVGYTFYNNRNYAITLNAAAFYMNIAGGAITIPCLDVASGNSVSIPAKTSKDVVMRFRLTVEEFNNRFAPVPNLSTQPMQNAKFNLAFRNPNNLVTRKNTSGVEVAESWQFYFQVLK